jgi:hypothetical protein
MKIKGLSNYRGRNPNGYFQDLPWGVRQRAYAWLSRFLKRHPYCPRWRFAILVGQAKRLALMSEEERSAWGRSMLAKRGGYAVQRRYWHEGRIGPDHPAHKAIPGQRGKAQMPKAGAAGAAAKAERVAPADRVGRPSQDPRHPVSNQIDTDRFDLLLVPS